MRPLAARAAPFAALALAGACGTDYRAGREPMGGAGIGAIGGGVSGYLLDDPVGGRHDREARVARAGIGPLAGSAVGAYMDRQERELRWRTRAPTCG